MIDWYKRKIEEHKMMAAMNIQNGIHKWMYHMREAQNYKVMLQQWTRLKS